MNVVSPKSGPYIFVPYKLPLRFKHQFICTIYQIERCDRCGAKSLRREYLPRRSPRLLRYSPGTIGRSAIVLGRRHDWHHEKGSLNFTSVGSVTILSRSHPSFSSFSARCNRGGQDWHPACHMINDALYILFNAWSRLCGCWGVIRGGTARSRSSNVRGTGPAYISRRAW